MNTIRALLALLLLSPALALAKDAGPAAAPTEAPAEAPAAKAPASPEASGEAPAPPPGWERVSGAGEAQAPIEAPPLVVAAYVVIWLFTLLYVLYLWRRQASLKAEIDALQARLQELDRTA